MMRVKLSGMMLNTDESCEPKICEQNINNTSKSLKCITQTK